MQRRNEGHKSISLSNEIKLEENLDADKSMYFNAWNFGQQEGDYELTIGTTIVEDGFVVI